MVGGMMHTGGWHEGLLVVGGMVNTALDDNGLLRPVLRQCCAPQRTCGCECITAAAHTTAATKQAIAPHCSHTQVCAGAVLGILAGYFFPYGRFCTAALAP